jgi:hypothetical protein
MGKKVNGTLVESFLYYRDELQPCGAARREWSKSKRHVQMGGTREHGGEPLRIIDTGQGLLSGGGSYVTLTAQIAAV